jgi:hypothetical protein
MELSQIALTNFTHLITIAGIAALMICFAMRPAPSKHSP